MDAWGAVAAVAVVGAVVALPVAAVAVLGGRRGRSRRRGGGRIRVGPGLPAVVVLALVRRADTVALAAITGAVVVLLALNART